MRDPVAYADAIYSAAYVSRLCPDILLKAFGTVYPAHRVILASQSVYFATLLRWVTLSPCGKSAADLDKDEWSCIPSHDLVLGEGVTRTGFEWILEYFYASPRLTIASDNAFDVLAAAHYLGVMAVQKACVNFISQHLDPHNFSACLAWATRVDHGEASDMLVTSCRRILALRLPRHLHTWAPAVVRLETRTLQDILASDFLAVQSEYDRYELVKAVVQLLVAAEGRSGLVVGSGGGVAGCSAYGESGGGAAAASACAESPEYSVVEYIDEHGRGWAGYAAVGRVRRGTDGSGGSGSCGSGGGSSRGGTACGGGGADGDGEGGGSCDASTTGGSGAVAAGTSQEVGGDLELQRMLSLALNVEGAGLPRHLRLARSSPAAIPLPNSTTSPYNRVVTVQPQTTAVQCGAWGIRSRMQRPLHDDGRAVSDGDGSGRASDAATTSLSSSLDPTSSVGASIVTMGTSPPSRGEAYAARSLFGSAASSRSRIDPYEQQEDTLTPPPPPAAEAEVDGQPACRSTAYHRRSDSNSSNGDGNGEGAGEVPGNDGLVASSDGGVAGSLTTGSIGGLLLLEAVRYEHLTVPQLMSVQQEGLVPPEILHTALWNRTRLEYAVQYPDIILGTLLPVAVNKIAAAAAAGATAAAGTAVNGLGDQRMGGGGGGRAAIDLHPPVEVREPPPLLEGDPAAVSAAASTGDRCHRASPPPAAVSLPGHLPPPQAQPQPQSVPQPAPACMRPFRICWILPVHVLRKLQPTDSVQSPYHAYAGALWQVRLCYSAAASGNSPNGGSGSGGAAHDNYLGVYLGRQKVGSSHPPAGALGPRVLPGSQQHFQRAAGAGRGPPGGGRHPMRGVAPPPRPRNPPRPQVLRPAPGVAQQQQIHPAAGAVVQAVVPAASGYIEEPPRQQQQQPWLRSRCRLSVFQSDNKMLQGRLCLGDSGEFTAEFVPGGYFGQARLLARSDLNGLPEDAEVVVFVAVQALAGYVDGRLTLD